jgi:hypothetical protein
MKKILITSALLLAGNVAFAQCDTTFSAWDVVDNSNANPANMITATTDNPLQGTCGMQVPLEFGGKRYVEDAMDNETSFRGSFYFDPNSVTGIPTSGEDRRVKIHNVQCSTGCAGGSVDWLQMKFLNRASGYAVAIAARESDGTKINNTFNLNDSCNTIEYQLVAGNPGIYRVWINNSTEGTPDFESTTVDFDAMFTDRVRLGKTAVGVNVQGTVQALTIDGYEARRQTFVSPTCAP